MTRAEAQSEVLKRLGDASAAIWSGTEIVNYLREGQRELVLQTGMLWDTGVLPDWPMAFTHTHTWEATNLKSASGRAVNYRANINYGWEWEYIHNTIGPANHTQFWEYQDAHVSKLKKTEISAVETLPENLHTIERSTWNTRRAEALRSRELEDGDGRYELNTGNVDGYARDKDGLGTIRKWRKPGTAYTPYTVTERTFFTHTAGWEANEAISTWTLGTYSSFTSPIESTRAQATSTGRGPLNHTASWEYSNAYLDHRRLFIRQDFGVLRQVTTITTEAVLGQDGIIRIFAGQQSTGSGNVRQVYSETSSLRFEYRRRPDNLSKPGDAFEVPDRYIRYIRFFAMWRALEREGPGQDLQLSAHYLVRFQAGVSRTKARMSAMHYQKVSVMNGQPAREERPPLARLPWQYGSTVR